jgi:predicted nucleic acid-binding protein
MPIIDASVLVAAVRSEEAQHTAARAWLESALRDEAPLIAPAILLSEVGGAIGRSTGREDLAHRIIHAIETQQAIELAPITVTLASAAAHLAADLGLRGADAIYVALAVQSREVLVTLDRELVERGGGVVLVQSPEAALGT